MTDNKSGEILIIEDDKDINDLLATALSKAGYRTRQAWSGTEGELLLKLDREEGSLCACAIGSDASGAFRGGASGTDTADGCVTSGDNPYGKG